ncbi:MAG: CARDB domain-containing protein [Candidatus Acetothermia bacterium]
MKLTKYKVGLLSLAIVLSVGMLLGVNSAVLGEKDKKTTYTIDSEEDLKDITGDYLSAVEEIGSDDSVDIEDGDTIKLDFEGENWEVTQTASLMVDKDVTIKPSEDDETVTLNQDSSWDGATTDDDEVDDNVDAAIVVLSDGVTLDSLEFNPENGGIQNAIEVDCCVFGDSLKFENLNIPVATSVGSFKNGIKFDGEVSTSGSCGGEEGSVYTDGITIKEVRISGAGENITGDGILFTDNVGNVENVSINKIYAGGMDSGAGIRFENEGSLKDVSITNSDIKTGSVFNEDAGIVDNEDGILIDGENVTAVEGFDINRTRIEENTDIGLFILGDDQYDGSGEAAISLIDGISVKNSKIAGNSIGILVASIDSDDEFVYSPIKVDGLHLGEDLEVFNNKDAGASFLVQVVDGSKSEPALTVSDSQFNEDSTGSDDDNEQGSGLVVNAYEGIYGAKISDSTFHDHDYESEDSLPGVGINLRTPVLDDDDDETYYDAVDGVIVEDTSAQNNGGHGFEVFANVVNDVDIKSSVNGRAKFSGNGEGEAESASGSGIEIVGQNRVSELSVLGEADGGNLLANFNEDYGISVESGDRIWGVEVENAKFGSVTDYNNGNGNTGARLLTTDQDSHIGGTDEDDEAISFQNVVASGNEGNGLEIISEGSFSNPKGKAVVKDSEFNENKEEGFYLAALESVKYPLIEDSFFLKNKSDTAGIFISAGGEDTEGEVLGSSSTKDIRGNVVADNIQGIAIGDPDNSSLEVIKNVTLTENTTEHPTNEEANGNSEYNMVLTAEELNSINVEDNRFIGPYDTDDGLGIGLQLTANDSSSSNLVQGNVFDSEASGFCIGDGTAIVLDAMDTDIRRNEFKSFSTAIEVKQENSDVSKAKDASNHINENNILSCCFLIDASELDYDDGQRVDATDNFWGEDVSKSDLNNENNMKTDSDEPLDQIFVEPLEEDPVGKIYPSISKFNYSPSEPKVDEKVTLEYTLKNDSEETISGHEVRIKVEDPTGTTVADVPKEDVPKLEPGETYSSNHSFIPTRDGDYVASLEVDEEVTESRTISVGEDPGPPKDDYEPDWDNTGIMPAPIDGETTPALEVRDSDGDPIPGEVIDPVTIKVFDVSGKKLETFESVSELNALENLQNGLYLYVVDITIDEDDYQSAVKKFVVKK